MIRLKIAPEPSSFAKKVREPGENALALLAGKPLPHKRRGKPIAATNDFVVKFANVNGSGSASANEMFARALLVITKLSQCGFGIAPGAVIDLAVEVIREMVASGAWPGRWIEGNGG